MVCAVVSPRIRIVVRLDAPEGEDRPCELVSLKHL
jgi:hypothetical protein